LSRKTFRRGRRFFTGFSCRGLNLLKESEIRVNQKVCTLRGNIY
jgi:hypothetical protein